MLAGDPTHLGLVPVSYLAVDGERKTEIIIRRIRLTTPRLYIQRKHALLQRKHALRLKNKVSNADTPFSNADAVVTARCDYAGNGMPGDLAFKKGDALLVRCSTYKTVLHPCPSCTFCSFSRTTSPPCPLLSHAHLARCLGSCLCHLTFGGSHRPGPTARGCPDSAF